jgi:hypothetical protein
MNVDELASQCKHRERVGMGRVLTREGLEPAVAVVVRPVGGVAIFLQMRELIKSKSVGGESGRED